MTKKNRISPALFATVVMASVAIFQVVFNLVTTQRISWDILSIILIDAAFWLCIYYMWRRTGRTRS
ncbi:hypothetical protein B0H03_10936 [Rathayibacter iranicus NCPPB 2253 = VKM Ac-1602]|uniref:Uncharacterized protein n=1 Tax=Rathayibacter iranicus NCPPB 2253 = VKM Ac-1602 TaxID=1328868 RepID=A0ABX5LAU4_9MICO|nr:hypothetical protein B0H03_10936 [Rathayibacter iranicus NCPPB 2253 = VKM Ac-1602]